MKKTLTMLSLLAIMIGNVAGAQYYNPNDIPSNGRSLLDRFAGNYNPISGPRTCGLHIEISRNTLIASNIVPPAVDADKFCSQLTNGCGGESFALSCNTVGDCFNDNGDLILRLLTDGNIFFKNSGLKLSRDYNPNYRWCVYN